jgi:SAM-dependent methyltransferase
MRVALLNSVKMFRDRVPTVRCRDKQTLITAGREAGPSAASKGKCMFANKIKDVDMEQLAGRSSIFMATAPLAAPASRAAASVPSPDTGAAPPLPQTEKPGFLRRLLTAIDPLRGRKMREAEKALFWDRLEGLAGDVRMMGYRYAEESRVRDAAVAALTEELAKRDRVIARLRGDLQFQRRRLNRLDRGEAVAAPAKTATRGPSAGEEIYLAFEERFRGSIDEIKRRLHPYLDRVRAHLPALPGRPLLDVGCGRGEWLELLAECGLDSYGVDLNGHAVAFCAERGLRVHCADVLEHLRVLPEGALGAITAFHLIEHLPLDSLRTFLEEARRTLVPSGLLMLESPNPESIKVGATTFHYDPTHLRPIPPQLADFFVGQAGFVDIEVVRLNPYPESSWVKEQSETAARLNELMFGPQDYAVIARKP